jgi:pimeloyl-ACP methyl ester carboxylesterase
MSPLATGDTSWPKRGYRQRVGPPSPPRDDVSSRAMSPTRIDLATWRREGSMIDTLDGSVFVHDTPGPDGATPLVILHGFPTSSHDFAAVIPALAEGRRVVAFDFLGFGYSAKPAGFSYSLVEQCDVTLAVLRALGVGEFHLWAHDMGTSVATELLARRERGLLSPTVRSLALMNGSVHAELAHPTLGQHVLRSPLGPLFARLNTRKTFVAQMRAIMAKPPSPDDLDAMWELVSRDDGALRLPAIIGYIAERKRFWHRWIGALTRLDLPTLVAWGLRDPVAVPAIAEQLAREIPGARLVTWGDLGHYPQVEDPARVAAVVGEFLREVEG